MQCERIWTTCGDFTRQRRQVVHNEPSRRSLVGIAGVVQPAILQLHDWGGRCCSRARHALMAVHLGRLLLARSGSANPLLCRAGRVPVAAVCSGHRSGGSSSAAAGATAARTVASAAVATAATAVTAFTAAASAVSVGMAQPGRCSSCGSGLVRSLLSGDACCCACKLGNSQLVRSGQVSYDGCPLSRCQLLVSHVTLKLWIIRSGYDITTVVHLYQFGCHRTDAQKSRPGGGGGGARFGMMNPEG